MKKENDTVSEETIEGLKLFKNVFKVETVEEVILKMAELAKEKILEDRRKEEKAPSYVKKIRKMVTDLIERQQGKIDTIDVNDIIREIHAECGYDERTVKKYMPVIMGILREQGVKKFVYDGEEWEVGNTEEKKTGKQKENDYERLYF